MMRNSFLFSTAKFSVFAVANNGNFEQLFANTLDSIKEPLHNLVETFPGDGAGLDDRDFLRHLRLQLLDLQHQQGLVAHLSVGVVHLGQDQAHFGFLQLRLGQNRVQQDALKTEKVLAQSFNCKK